MGQGGRRLSWPGTAGFNTCQQSFHSGLKKIAGGVTITKVHHPWEPKFNCKEQKHQPDVLGPTSSQAEDLRCRDNQWTALGKNGEPEHDTKNEGVSPGGPPSRTRENQRRPPEPKKMVNKPEKTVNPGKQVRK